MLTRLLPFKILLASRLQIVSSVSSNDLFFFLSLLLSAPGLLEEKVGGKSVACQQQEAQWCFRELFP